MKHINITLVFEGNQYDLRIPINIEVRRLIREIDKIFKRDGVRLKYQLRVLNKGLILDEGQVLSAYPIATGDILRIEEMR